MTPPAISAESIAVALHARRMGARWFAKCPAHEEKTASLSIREIDGLVLVHCFGGCRQSAVLRELRARGLWPEKPPLTPAERRAWGLARRRAEQEAAECLAWYSTLCSDLEQDKAAAAADADPWLRFEPAARELARLTGSRPAEILAEFRRRAVREPRVTVALVKRGRDVDAAVRGVLSMIGRYWRTHNAVI